MIYARPVRVCYLINRLGIGGTEIQLLKLIRSLDRRRVEPHLCLLDGEDDESRSLEPGSCEVLRLGVATFGSVKAARQAINFAASLRRWRIDVLQLHHADSTYFGALVGRLAGVPRIVATRRGLYFWATSAHKNVGPWLDIIYHRMLVDAMLANCQACLTAVTESGIPVPRRTVIIENGADLASLLGIPPPPEHRARTEPLRVGTIAWLRPIKRIDLLVRAAAELCSQRSDITFEVVGEGDGNARPTLERQIKDARLGDRFALPGVTNDVESALGRFDIAVLCSDSEALSNSLIEYMAAGRAVVATAVGATPTVIEHGVTGLLIPPGDAGALAAAIRRLADDAPLRRRLGAAAREAARRRFSMSAMVRNHEAFYCSLMDRHDLQCYAGGSV